ncbi:hypothetical protein MKZ38_008850 [Zalerion maritima]|uniref:Uncharacterized protein n=1 Tax=Zalerion maritima TaxID=339359 RepID=A0AAD5RH24_9PEZI|nr:hypothetical protein MKZ38_008850 [Zalerion maritima]
MANTSNSQGAREDADQLSVARASWFEQLGYSLVVRVCEISGPAGRNAFPESSPIGTPTLAEFLFRNEPGPQNRNIPPFPPFPPVESNSRARSALFIPGTPYLGSHAHPGSFHRIPAVRIRKVLRRQFPFSQPSLSSVSSIGTGS